MTIDTNILIAYLAGDEAVIQELSQWRARGIPLFLSPIVETEILSFAQWTPEERHAAAEFLEKNFTPIAFDRPLARTAADIRRTVKIKVPDAAIAATALYTNTPVVTKNVRDFKHVPGLRVVRI